MATSENENVVDIGCEATQENEKANTPHLDTNESISMPISQANTVTGPSTKRLKSIVWNHFEVVKENDQRRWAMCKHCNKRMTGRPNDGTSHLKDHIQKCPRRVTKDIRQQILLQEQTTKDGKSALLSSYKFSAEQSRQDLADMIIIHDYPLSIVDHYGFRKYSKGLEPLFNVPCRGTIKSDIMTLYETKKVSVLSWLGKNDSRIALTSDLWTASNQNKGYMAITAHFIDADWKLQNRIIRLFYAAFYMCHLHTPPMHCPK